MRRLAVCLGALFLAGCSNPHETQPKVDEPAPAPPVETLAEPAPDIPGYDESWYISDFWPGEYPDGFIIGGENTVLPGRSEMKRALPHDVDCAVEKGANYSPWNHDRVEADDLIFRSAAKMTPVFIMGDVEIETGFSQDVQPLSLKSGDVILYKSYLAEGYFLGEFDGETYELNEADLMDFADFQFGGEDDLWVNVACTGGERAWLLLREVQREPFILPTEYTSFGETSDVLAP
ncbi:MAG: hypothetical protein QNI84_15730 [Henriciella sp.]|nr:hypothetical protein [Henriciella sp.]